jgi:hypothetical protein
MNILGAESSTPALYAIKYAAKLLESFADAPDSVTRVRDGVRDDVELRTVDALGCKLLLVI